MMPAWNLYLLLAVIQVCDDDRGRCKYPFDQVSQLLAKQPQYDPGYGMNEYFLRNDFIFHMM
jgi:hypothetical protein